MYLLPSAVKRATTGSPLEGEGALSGVEGRMGVLINKQKISIHFTDTKRAY